MAGTLLIKITKASGEIRDLRFRCMWSAWLDGRLIANGHVYKSEEVEPYVLDLVTPDDVERIEIIER
jgi:hypothetical protein